MKFIKTPVKGMCDMLPADMRLREHILQMIKTSYASYGFMQIETPVMEHIENLTSKQGGDNEKLIFKVMKRGADLTRAIEAGMQPKVLQKLLGHASIQTTMDSYVHVTSDSMDQAVKQFENNRVLEAS